MPPAATASDSLHWPCFRAWSGRRSVGPDARPAGFVPLTPDQDGPRPVAVVTWGGRCGREAGPVWRRFARPRRKPSLRAGLAQTAPGILCVQEALADPVAFLEQALPARRRVGVGRDEGQSGGEFSA